MFAASERVVWRAKLVRVHAQNARHSKTKVVNVEQEVKRCESGLKLRG